MGTRSVARHLSFCHIEASVTRGHSPLNSDIDLLVSSELSRLAVAQTRSVDPRRVRACWNARLRCVATLSCHRLSRDIYALVSTRSFFFFPRLLQVVPAIFTCV